MHFPLIIIYSYYSYFSNLIKLQIPFNEPVKPGFDWSVGMVVQVLD